MTAKIELNFEFSNGANTCDMKDARGLSLLELSTWLNEIEKSLDAGSLSNTDCALISCVFGRVERALNYDHGIVVPYHLVYGKPEKRVSWLASNLRDKLSNRSVAESN